MIVTVKEYLEETHEISCIIDRGSEFSGSVIIVDPFVLCAIETTDDNFREVGRSMPGKVYEMTDFEINDDSVYCPKKFKHIPSFEVPVQNDIKTQPCPACGKPLITPKEYFPALTKMNEAVHAYREVLIKDYEVDKKKSKQAYALSVTTV